MSDLPSLPLPLLAVDDRPNYLFVLKTLLQPLRHPIVTVTSGREALVALLKEEFALALLDVLMPDLDGVETARLIRQHPRLHALSLIFLTSAIDAEDRVRQGAISGPTRVLSKPVTPDLLLRTVSEFLAAGVR